jgi:hypothetical protein
MMTRWILSLSLVAVVLVLSVVVLQAEEPAADAKPEPKVRAWDVPEILKRVPPLKHDNTGRLPMICITPFAMHDQDKSFERAEPLSPEIIRELKARGLTQRIPPRERYIPYALALQAEGAGVIIVEDSAFNGPGGQYPDETPLPGSHHILPEGYKGLPRPGQQPVFPCPLLLDGWKIKADSYREVFKKFKEAGVDVTGVWLDLEVEPYHMAAQWDESKNCERCRKLFPRGVLDDHKKYEGFIMRWRANVFGAYIAAPILEVYPGISVTNWAEVISTADIPAFGWTARGPRPPHGVGLYTAANPVVYGTTLYYRQSWRKEAHPDWPLDVPHMDRLYTQLMLSQISTHEANARRVAPELLSIPWVDRFCADDKDPKIPILSRERYREILRHTWLRGADGMQIFNPVWFEDDPVRSPIVVEEIEDAVIIYDEMLAFREFLDDGETMDLTIPQAQYNGPIWSGLKLKDRALIRAFTMNAEPVTAKITPFEGGPEVELAFPPEGATYILTLAEGKVGVEKK